MKQKENLRRLAVFWAMAVLLMVQTSSDAAEAVPASPAPAGQVKEETKSQLLKLEEAVRIALENHPRIRAAGEKVGAQQAVLGQQFSAYYPTVTESNSYRTSNATGGGDVSARSFDRFTGQASFNMTLYNFGKREGNVQSARDTLEATEYDYRTTVSDIVLGAKQAYFAYLQARALLRVREETVKDRELLAQQARGFFEVGTRARIDVARAEANLYTAQADLIAAQNALRVAWTTLKNAMGMPDMPEQQVAEEFSIAPVALSLEQAKKNAFASRPELKSFEAQRKAQDEKIAAARRGHLPDILFSATYGRTGQSPRAVDEHPNTFPLEPSWSVQLNFNIPIFDGFNTTYKVEEAVRNYYSVKALEENQKQQVAFDVEQSYSNVVNSLERIKATEAAERAAKENFDLAKGRYQVGVGSIIEVADAETAYTDAQTNHVRARYDYKIAEAQLTRAMGGQ